MKTSEPNCDHKEEQFLGPHPDQSVARLLDRGRGMDVGWYLTSCPRGVKLLPCCCHRLYPSGVIYNFQYEDYFGGEQFLGESC
jgi:hypothetical protein